MHMGITGAFKGEKNVIRKFVQRRFPALQRQWQSNGPGLHKSRKDEVKQCLLRN